jgi:hypothetical protein
MSHRATRTSLVIRCAALAALVAAPVAFAIQASLADSADAAPGPVKTDGKPDFNGDGYADTATGAAGGSGGGYVAVVYGSANGTDTGHSQTLRRPTAVDGGQYGSRTAARDLNEDGYTDLAVYGGVAGAIVHWGSGKGLGSGVALTDYAEADSGNLTAGDFNGDGHPDLVANAESFTDNVKLRVAYGPFNRSGKAAKTADLATGEIDAPTDIIAGDTTGDGKDDLVTTHAFEEMSNASKLWRGTGEGLLLTDQTLDDAATGTVGDVDGDGYGDLVIRPVPGGVVENLPYDKGTVKVLYGTKNGPSKTRTTTITQDTSGVPGIGEEGDQFGYQLSANDANGDGYADVAVGVPYENLNTGQEDTGAVVLLKGGAGGLSGSGAQAFNQSTSGVPGIAEKGDHFGSAVQLLDTNKDGKSDLAVGTPGEDGAYTNSGAVWTLRGATGGLTTSGVVSYGPDALGAPPSGAQLGESLPR